MDRKLKNFKIKTAYNQISVKYCAGELEFRSPDNALQSVIDLKKTHRLALVNLEYMIAILLFIPAPKRILMLGTAAGSLLHFLRHYYPESHITAVDIDSELIEKLLQMNILPEADPQLDYVYDDAIHFISHCQQNFDLILVDVFNGTQSPRWVGEKNKLDILRNLLTEHGAIAFNLLIDSDHEFKRFYTNLRLTCQKQTLCMPVEGFENTIAYGFKEQLPQRDLAWYMEHTLEMSHKHSIDYMAVLSAIYTTNPSGEAII
jgi:spermidine synthase